jgi:hypothetical protein
MSSRDVRAATEMAAVVVGLHAVGVLVLIVPVAPHRYGLGAPRRKRPSSACSSSGGRLRRPSFRLRRLSSADWRVSLRRNSATGMRLIASSQEET